LTQFIGLSLTTHFDNIINEFRSLRKIYGYHENTFYRKFPGLDLSIDFHGKKAATPIGPAAGPHTQMAQNIVLAFLMGARVIELKTVQTKENIHISRPCVDMRNIGYNVEWSQEMSLENTYKEYVIAWMLIKFIEQQEILKVDKGDPFYSTIFDISIGYDLKEIQSPTMHKWIERMRMARDLIQLLLDQLPPKYAHYRKMKIDPHITNSITLSTFHGCPAQEIENIVKYLVAEHQLHVIIKFNPTILGYEYVEYILKDKLGYQNIDYDRAVFENDLQFNDAVVMLKRLHSFAKKYDKNVGVKFTNSLIVNRSDSILKDKVQYLTGTPLHVLALHAVQKFRTHLNSDFIFSFSGGVDKSNIVDTLLCNLRPVTVCTDLLKKRGYSRFCGYLNGIKTALKDSGCSSLDDLIRFKAQINNLTRAGKINMVRVVKKVNENPKYHYNFNHATPKKIGSLLQLFDCISCDICLKVCPNGANFSIFTGKNRQRITNFKYANGNLRPITGQMFLIEKECQIANLADFCNDCGNCDTFCPEDGGPYIVKPRFFSSQQSYKKNKNQNGFYFLSQNTLLARMSGPEYRLTMSENKKDFIFLSDDIVVDINEGNDFSKYLAKRKLKNDTLIDMKPFYIMKELFEGIKRAPDNYAKNIVYGCNS
jgi:putative selenate reductase